VPTRGKSNFDSRWVEKTGGKGEANVRKGGGYGLRNWGDGSREKPEEKQERRGKGKKIIQLEEA